MCACVSERQREGQTDKDLHYCLPTYTNDLHLVASFTNMRVLLQPPFLDSVGAALCLTVKVTGLILDMHKWSQIRKQLLSLAHSTDIASATNSSIPFLIHPNRRNVKNKLFYNRYKSKKNKTFTRDEMCLNPCSVDNIYNRIYIYRSKYRVQGYMLCNRTLKLI